MFLTIVLTFVAVALFVVFMSVGLIIKGKELKGTCASKNALVFGNDGTCSICGQEMGSCKNEDDLKMETVKS